MIQRVRNRLRRHAEPLHHLPDRLVRERDRIVGTLGPRWKRALAAALRRWAFDYGTLLAALRALDSAPRPGLVLLAFCAAQMLAQIPLTPGGLGFVEAGLSATLTLAGVAAGTPWSPRSRTGCSRTGCSCRSASAPSPGTPAAIATPRRVLT